jgi:hypothetical protein
VHGVTIQKLCHQFVSAFISSRECTVTSAAMPNQLLSTDNDSGADGDNDCMGEVAALLRRAGENRRAAETVARHLLSRLDSASTTGGMGPWDDYSHTTRWMKYFATILLFKSLHCYLYLTVLMISNHSHAKVSIEAWVVAVIQRW